MVYDRYKLLIYELNLADYYNLFYYKHTDKHRLVHNREKIIDFLQKCDDNNITGEERRILLYAILYSFLIWEPQNINNIDINIAILKNHNNIKKNISPDLMDKIIDIMLCASGKRKCNNILQMRFLEFYSNSFYSFDTNTNIENNKKNIEEDVLLRKELSYIPWKLYKKMRLNWLSQYKDIYFGCKYLYEEIENMEVSTLLIPMNNLPSKKEIDDIIKMNNENITECGLLLYGENRYELKDKVRQMNKSILIYHSKEKNIKDKNFTIYTKLVDSSIHSN